MAKQLRQHRDHGEKNRAGKCQSCHCEIEKIRRRLSRSHTWDVTAVFLEIIGDLSRLKLRRDPEVTEKENHRGKKNIMRPAVRHRIRNLIGDATVFANETDDRRREKK